MPELDDTVTVSVLPTEAMTAAQRSAVIDVCIAAHENEDFRKLFELIPSGGRHFLAHRDSELVSHAVVTTRWLQADGGRTLRTAFVDAVSTRPADQGKGCGTAVMRQLAVEIGDYEIACLQTDDPGFYERLGWTLWLGPLAGRDGTELVPTPEQQGVMVLRVLGTPKLDVTDRLTIECQPSRIWE